MFFGGGVGGKRSVKAVGTEWIEGINHTQDSTS